VQHNPDVIGARWSYPVRRKKLPSVNLAAARYEYDATYRIYYIICETCFEKLQFLGGLS